MVFQLPSKLLPNRERSDASTADFVFASVQCKSSLIASETLQELGFYWSDRLRISYAGCGHRPLAVLQSSRFFIGRFPRCGRFCVVASSVLLKW